MDDPQKNLFKGDFSRILNKKPALQGSGKESKALRKETEQKAQKFNPNIYTNLIN